MEQLELHVDAFDNLCLEASTRDEVVIICQPLLLIGLGMGLHLELDMDGAMQFCPGCSLVQGI
eukprot:15259862-Ditylum_brightwellii.AAC.1